MNAKNTATVFLNPADSKSISLNAAIDLEFEGHDVEMDFDDATEL